MKTLKLLSKIALSFQNLSDFDQDMEDVLKNVGNGIDVSRIYIFFNKNKEIMNITYEWCNEGVIPQIEYLQKLKYKDVPSWDSMLMSDGCICSNDIMDLPDDIVNVLKPQQIKSLLAYPLIVENEIRGFIGFDECRYKRKWNTEELEILKTLSGIISNAYERKLFQQDIIASETNFRNFFETIDDMLIISDLEGRIIYGNKALVNKLGYSPVELNNMNILELHSIENREEASIILEKMLKEQNEYCTLDVEGKLGDIFSVETRIWFGKWNKQDCIYSISKDVTKEKENLKLFSKIFENNPLPMSIISIDENRFIKINPAFSLKIGYSEDEIIGKTVEELNVIIDFEKFKILQFKRMKKEKIYDEELTVRCKDGSLITGIFSVEEISNQGKKSLLTVMVDITLKKQSEERLKESEKRFLLALDETKAGLWDFDMINNNVFLSPMWKNLLGYKDDEIQDSFDAWKILWHPDDRENIQKSIDDYLSGKLNRYEIIHRLKHKDGNWRWILTRGGVLKDDSGKPYRWIGTNIDITIEKEQALELERFFSINLDLLCIADMDGNFIKTNKAWEDILGYSSKELSTRKFLEFVHPEDISITLEAMEQLKKDKKVVQFINRYISADGDYHYIEWRSNPYGSLIYAAARDVTERIEYEIKLLEVSNKDSLTNVYNRRYIYKRGEEIIEESKRTGKVFSVCIMDIDYFKAINDNYGHRIGDCVLIEFTKVINENLRPYDILGRYGGEEFIIILNNSDIKQSFLIIERILDIVRNKTFIFDGIEIKFTFSAGILNSEELAKDLNTIDNMVNIADKRMYHAKNTGRNKIIYNMKTMQL